MERQSRDASLSRRQFAQTTGALSVAALIPDWMSSQAHAAPTLKSSAETSAAKLFASLTAEQRKMVALPWDSPLRMRINPNWQITKLHVDEFKDEQQKLITEVVKGVTSKEGFEKFIKQMDDDDGGIGSYSIALFGNPETNKFQFELTGRHLTLRADGDTVPGAAFGGPIVYGHARKGNSPKNLFSYQTDRANAVFAALDGKQREKALIEKAPRETAVQIRKAGSPLPGIAGSELSEDQKKLVLKSLQHILMPYRQEDIDEAMKILEVGGGIDSLHFAFYKKGDIGGDQKWDIWRLESPTLVCHFRGAPHVHAYINIATKA